MGFHQCNVALLWDLATPELTKAGISPEHHKRLLALWPLPAPWVLSQSLHGDSPPRHNKSVCHS